jgi:hypothetical protein
VFGKHNIIRAQQLENQVLTLSPNYLSKFKTLKTLCEECKINIKEDFVFVSTFYAMQEALGTTYEKPSLEIFCDVLIREQDKLEQLGVINTPCMLQDHHQQARVDDN